MTKQELYEEIVKLIEEKGKAKIHPTHVTLFELYKKFGKGIRIDLLALVKEEKLYCGDTINDKYFKIKNKL